MKYKAITVSTTTEGAELVSDLFFGICGQGVSIIDANDLKELYKGEIIWDYIDESVFTASNVVRVTGYTDEENFQDALEQLNQGLENLKANFQFPLGSLEISIEEVDGDDWFNSWKKFYQPIKVDGITVVPIWQKIPEEGTVIKINPGMAFGTGEHESTQMCLSLLQREKVTGLQVSDIGCGSGILGISALKLGAKNCYFSDIDATALENLKENIRLNGVFENSVCECASLADGNPPQSDLVFANITADILIMLSKSIHKVLKKGGTLILSGIIATREEEVISAYQEAGLRVENRLALKDWRGFTLKS